MNDSQATSLEEIRALVEANRVVRFAGQGREDVYDWVVLRGLWNRRRGLRRKSGAQTHSASCRVIHCQALSPFRQDYNLSATWICRRELI